MTAESGAQIEAAEAAVEALNDKQRDKLPNLTVLEEAQTEYETVLEEQAVTEACVQEAENAIDAIGSVTLDSGDAIRAARAAYDAVPEEAREQVTNRETLAAAEQTFDALAIQATTDAINAIGDVTLDSGEAIRAASRRIPIVWSENFSVGVTVLVRLARLAAQALGREFDMEIVETHHNRKVDAPSGTAKLILRQIDPEGLYAPVYGRSGRIGARGREIGVHAVRGGTAAGEHSLRFFGRMEELELRHRADSREIFAQGALRAAAFARKAEPGLYDMEDVLFGGDGWTRS